MTRDLHVKPFDEATITKLDIFISYLKNWIPVFIKQDSPKIYIVDFFAGPGKDKGGKLGSPLRIIDILEEYREQIQERAVPLELKVIFNEYDSEKYEELRKNVGALRDNLYYSPILYKKDFTDLFCQLENELVEAPCLLFMDQNGIKQITKNIIRKLERFERTDFLFYISSSYFYRFIDDPAFKQYFPELDRDELRKTDYYSIHREIIKHYRQMRTPFSKTRLFPFSIKKGANIYGLIFGSKHILGIDKFLDIAWKKNRINGEANFDIDGDVGKVEQPSLFAELKRFTKIEDFEKRLKSYLSSKDATTNKEIYDFSIDNGFTHKHAMDVVKKLIQDKQLLKSYDERGLYIGYRQCYKDERIVRFKWNSK